MSRAAPTERLRRPLVCSIGLGIGLAACGASAPAGDPDTTAAAGAAEAPPTFAPPAWSLLYAETFDSVTAGEHGWDCSDPAAWRHTEDGTLELFGSSEYAPRVRSPRNLALIPNSSFGDFALRARLLQTGREYGHRDMCVFFGFDAPDRFYYVHLATKADDHAHNVFVVDGAPRVKFATSTGAGVDWGDGVWHDVGVLRQGARIEVYFDDFEEPIMVAEDERFTRGRIGIGSFDDTGKIDDVRVWGELGSRLELTGAPGASAFR